MEYCRSADAAMQNINTEKAQPCYTDTSGAPSLPGHGYSTEAQNRPGPLQRKPKKPETLHFGGKKKG